MNIPKVLVVYATKYGQTRKIAERIADVVRGEGALVDLWKPGDDFPDIRRYNDVIVASPVYFGRHPSSVARWVRQHRDWLPRLHTAFLSISLTANSPSGHSEAMKAVASFIRATKWAPNVMRVFGGALPYTRYNPILRLVMRAIAKRHGGDTDTSRDYEYTNWDAVDAFARAFVSRRPEKLAA